MHLSYIYIGVYTLNNLAAHDDPSLVQSGPDALESAGMFSMRATTTAAVLQHHSVIH